MKSKMKRIKISDLGDAAQIGAKSNAAFFAAVGFAALFAAGVLLYMKFHSGDDGVAGKGEQVLSASEIKVQEAMQAKLPVKKGDMLVPAQEKLSGRWFTRFGSSAIAEITFKGDSFEIIYTQDAQGRARKYSRGVYRFDEGSGVLSLMPSRQAGAPAPIPGVFYKVLTMRPFDLYVLQKRGDYDLYFMAPEEDVLAKAVHPLFLFADYAGAPVLKFSPVQIK